MNKQIDMFARRPHFIDHLIGIWNRLPVRNRGRFYVPEYLLNYVADKYSYFHSGFSYLTPRSSNPLDVVFQSDNPLVTCAYGDLVISYKFYSNRMFILMEHGVGLTMTGNAGYAGGLGYRSICDLFLAPNEFIANKTAKVLDTPQVVIGTPKLDEWEIVFNKKIMSDQSTKSNISDSVVCIAFHWNGSHVSPEAGNAFEQFKGVIPSIAKEFKVIGHGHPKERDHFKEYFDSIGVEYVEDFRDVMRRADVYVNDASSTLYEFLVTGKPVVMMNALHYRKSVNHGIRFWDYTDIGYQVSQPHLLLSTIKSTLTNPQKHAVNRKKAVEDLYPHLGKSSALAVESIMKFVGDGEMDKLVKTDNYQDLKTMLSGANNSTKGISNIEIQHLSWLGSQLIEGTNVVEVGSHRGKSICCIGSGLLKKTGGKIDGRYKLYCVDLWRKGFGKTFDHYSSEESYRIFTEQVEKFGLSELVKPVEMDSAQASVIYKKNQHNPIGLLFIDGDHKNGSPQRDFENWSSEIISGGYVVFHYYGTRFKDVDKVINEVIIPSGLYEDYTVVHRLWSAKKK